MRSPYLRNGDRATVTAPPAGTAQTRHIATFQGLRIGPAAFGYFLGARARSAARQRRPFRGSPIAGPKTWRRQQEDGLTERPLSDPCPHRLSAPLPVGAVRAGPHRYPGRGPSSHRQAVRRPPADRACTAVRPACRSGTNTDGARYADRDRHPAGRSRRDRRGVLDRCTRDAGASSRSRSASARTKRCTRPTCHPLTPRAAARMPWVPRRRYPGEMRCCLR